MDRTNNTCPHCGRVQPKDNLISGVCWEKLEGPTEKAITFFRPSEHKYSQRRRLIVGLVLGGVGLATISSGVLLGEGSAGTLPSTPANLPADRHCVLNLPFDMVEWTTLVWSSDM